VDDSDEDQDYVGEDEDESESSDDGVSAAKITNRPQEGVETNVFFAFLLLLISNIVGNFFTNVDLFLSLLWYDILCRFLQK
jgi:hypothetical protein